MRRRQFITLIGGAAAAWPLAARAQQGERVRRVGAIMGSTGTGRSDVAAFQQALQQLGWIDGRSVRIDYRFGLVNAADIRRHTAELVALKPDLILAGGDPVKGPRRHRRPQSQQPAATPACPRAGRRVGRPAPGPR